jgi:hypothetical protein
MADYVAAHITIGGRVSERIVPALCQAISEQQVGLEWGAWNFCPGSAQALLKARRKIGAARVLRLYSDEMAYGNFDLLQEFLVDHQLPFDRWHDAKYEIPCELMVYRPESELRFFLTNLQEEIVVRAEPLMGLPALLQETRQLLRARGKEAALQALRRCQRLAAEHLPPVILPLPALAIVAT